MPRVCASVNCREIAIKGSPYSFHLFPKDPKRRLQWARNINRKQPESGKLWMPQNHDVICAKHFTKESFTMQTRISREGGIPFLPRLEPDAVPTIFVRNKENRNIHQPASDSQPANTSAELQNKVNMTTSTVSNSRANLYKSLSDLYKLPGVTKLRGAYIKREHQRVLSDIFTSLSDASMSSSERAAKDVDGCYDGVTLLIADCQNINEAEQTDIVCSVHHSSAHEQGDNLLRESPFWKLPLSVVNMPIKCIVYGCSCKSATIRIPKVVTYQGKEFQELTERRRREWIRQIRRRSVTFYSDRQHHRLCHRHFHTGQPAKPWDQNHPDWIPTLCMGYPGAKSTDSARYARAVRRRLKNVKAPERECALSAQQSGHHLQQVTDYDSVKTCRQTRTKSISYHEKHNGAITASRFPRNVAGICEVAQQALKGERNPAIGREHSIHSEQTLDSPHQFMVVTMDDLLEPYTIIHPAGTNISSTDPLHHKGSDTIMGGWHHTWSSMNGQRSVDFDNDIEVKREVSSDQEEDLAVSPLLEPCLTQDMIENSSQYCHPYQMRLKRKVRSCLNSKVQESGLLLQPKCELQSPPKLTKVKSRCSNSEIQDHHTRMSQFVDIKKELMDFDTSGVTQAGDHNFNSKSKRPISKSSSDEHPFVNVLSSVSIKKEPQDFETSWNAKSVTQITHRSFKSRAKTGTYPTGIYHNVHCVEMRTADR